MPFRVAPAAVAVGVALLVTSPGCSAEPAASPPPTVERATDRSRIDQAMVACLRQAGYDAVVAPGAQGGVEWASADEQQAEADRAYQGCLDRLTAEGVLQPSEPLTAVQLDALYDEMLKTEACLAREGIETGTAPSREKFVTEGGQWTPYLEVPADISGQRWDDLLRECPQPGQE